MTLPMSRPWLHPDTGIYWFRKVVPKDLRPILGQTEIKKSLETRDPAKAKVAHAKMLAEVEAQLANLRKGPTKISEREAHDISREFYEAHLARFADNPNQNSWDVGYGFIFDDELHLRSELDRLKKPPNPDNPFSRFPPKGTSPKPNLRYCEETVSQYLVSRGLDVDEMSRLNLIRAAGRAFQRASLKLQEYAKGDFADTGHTAPSIRRSPSTDIPAAAHVSFNELFEGWAKERKPRLKTRYSWKIVVDKLAAFLNTADASQLTPEDLIRWKNAMLDEGLAGKTIRDGKIAPVKAILQWGVDNRRLSANPAERIVISAQVKPGEKKRGFHENEARTILSAALNEADLARRWIPWLGAYSGARVSELSQLRKSDVFELDDIWCMRITADAGEVKNSGSERIVPLHSALIEMGFLEFAGDCKDGPLFAHVALDRFGNRGGNVSKRIGNWVRALGVDDPRIQPNHGWRHRFRTIARQHRIDGACSKAITGHTQGNEGDKYGEFPISVLKHEIQKLPKISFDKPAARQQNAPTMRENPV